MRVVLMKYKMGMLEIPSTFEINYMKIRTLICVYHKMFPRIKKQILSKIYIYREEENVEGLHKSYTLILIK